MRSAFLLAVVGCCLPAPAFADDCPADMNQAKVTLMMDTHLIAVMNLSVPASQYVSKEPDSLEIVFLSKPEDGDSRVSPDGNVIFLQQGASQETQQELTLQAFDIRIRRQYPEKCFLPAN